MPALRAGVLLFTELCADLRAGVLNIHITVNFTELCAAFRAGVLNFHITVILEYYACSQGRSTQF